MSFSNVYFILHKPQLPENIGLCARALKNFNFSKLRLVSPKVEFPNEKTLAASVGAKNIILSTKVFKNFEESIKDTHYIIATTSRFRKKNYKYISLSDLKKINFKKKIAFVFGSESSGLSNNEISFANYVLKFPTNKKFKSLNLSHSLVIICYEIFKILNKKGFNLKKYEQKIINKGEFNKFITFLIKKLDDIGFLQPIQKRNDMIKNIRSIFHKMNLTDKEMRILMGIIASLKEKSPIDKSKSVS